MGQTDSSYVGKEAKTSDPQFKTSGDQYAIIEDACPFENRVYQGDIEPGEITDTRKKPDKTWNHFFNNYHDEQSLETSYPQKRKLNLQPPPVYWHTLIKFRPMVE